MTCICGTLAAMAIGVSSAEAAKSKRKGGGKAAGNEPQTTIEAGKTVGKAPDLSKPVKVFILMGQSNMVGMGKLSGGEGSLENAVKEKKKYPYLLDDEGKWAVSANVRNIYISMNALKHNDWMCVTNRDKVGTEYGIGHFVGEAIDGPVMILKSCIGNRGLGWDLLPPGSESWEVENAKTGKTMIYAGYKQSPSSWEKGTEPKPTGWYAGKEYDTDVENAKQILGELDNYYPGAKSYEVAGFLWWQGDKDMRDPAYFNTYEKHLVELIKALRKDFNAHNAPFVSASLGQTKEGSTSGDGKIMEAMKNVADPSKYPDLGKVGFVYTHPLSMGGSSSAHYGGNAETYMNVGEAMGKAMAGLLKGE
jgi:hypothetical protein